MVFLKRFRAYGFKSYADEITINFTHSMTGIVGPNGSGKSNVVDALKWVLGERSMKHLRSKSGDDMIFFGSKDKPASKLAEVELTFDNSQKLLHDPRPEISVMRRIYRGSGQSEYYINGELVTLKEISGIFADIGLEKGSLGIISQGSVSWFVEAKPEERRKIFEDASGIGRYTKRKEEVTNQLARTVQNLKQVSIVLNELKKDLKKLTIQADKAQRFVKLKEELKELELSVLVADYLKSQGELDRFNHQIGYIEQDFKLHEPQLQLLEDQLNIFNQRFRDADEQSIKLQQELQAVYQTINELEQRKAVIDVQLKNELSKKDEKHKIQALKKLIRVDQAQLESLQAQVLKTTSEITLLTNELSTVQTELDTTKLNLNQNSAALVYQQAQQEFLKAQNEEWVKTNPAHVLVKNVKALTGLLNTLNTFLKFEKQYEKALLKALGKSIGYLVVNNNLAALKAIDFLLTNQIGQVTFLPIDDIAFDTKIVPEHMEILQQLDGFLGVGSDHVSCDERLQPIVNALLGQVIIASDLQAALKLSSYTYKLYRVVTLNGETVYAGGIIQGGYVKDNLSLYNLQEKLASSEANITQLEHNEKQLRTNLTSLETKLNELNKKLKYEEILLEKFNERVNHTNKAILSYKIEYEQLTNESFYGTPHSFDETRLVESLNRAWAERDELNSQLKLNQELKETLAKSIKLAEAKTADLRALLDEQRSQLVLAREGKIRFENTIHNITDKINGGYKLTMEFAIANYNKPIKLSTMQAQNKIARMQSQLDEMGPINLESIAEIADKQKRFDDINGEYESLQTAIKDLQTAIGEIDELACKEFDELIQKVNAELPKTFNYLFGGGSCQIRYTDTDNVLLSGIEVFANPPGKNVANLMLLSGGEKTLVALSVLFSILRVSAFPLVILDEAESALDPANVERFANIIGNSSNNTQFLIITHRQGTMMKCDMLLGAAMQTKGVTKTFAVSLEKAEQYISKDKQN
ncbi:chromosome partition protein Smc [Mycoplasmoides pneumoniae]|uniref:AAA family ATPase n=1 Tax=Mycoplasmoides pneumoniae TaxID=2104 RepID=UPI0013306326|nr:AAA family ATPase [Mycoplasmoides pneumoniae]GLL59908.1 chromosome partition protein Smc [Mycoplasmoides pneumoniae]